MIKPLTSLRFVFAFMVFLTHMSFLISSGGKTYEAFYYRFFYEGYIGVGFFFMLSGFILSYTYKESLLAEQSGKLLFYIKRLARIYPLHLITLLISIPVFLMEESMDTPIFTKQFFANVFLLQSFGPDRSYFFSGNALSWSISNELFFYALFPFLILAFHYYKWFTRVLLFVGCMLVIWLLPQINGGVEQHTFFYINPFTRLIDFALGILLFDIYKWLKGKNIASIATALEIVAVLLMTLFLYFHDEVSQAARYASYYWLPVAALILIFSFQAGKLSALLSQKWMVMLGEISFAFYMFHQLVIRYYQQLNADFFQITDPWVSIGFVLVLALVISYAAYYLIEKPLNSYIVSLVKKK